MKIALAIVMCVVALVWTNSDSLPFQSEVTVYHLFCKGVFKDGICDSQEETANPTTYKALVEQQTVVYWIGSGAPQRYHSCAVRDARNWSCSSSDDNSSIEWHMIDGQYGKIGGFFPEIFYPAPKWRWWQVWLSEKIDSKLAR